MQIMNKNWCTYTDCCCCSECCWGSVCDCEHVNDGSLSVESSRNSATSNGSKVNTVTAAAETDATPDILFSLLGPILWH